MAKIPSENQLKALAKDLNSKAKITLTDTDPGEGQDLPEGEFIGVYGDENDLAKQLFPVGSIFITTTGTNPQTWLGGTWAAFGEGRTLVGVQSSDSDFATPNKTGGSKTVTLRALIGAIDSLNNKIGYQAATKVPGQNYSIATTTSNGASGVVPESDVNHSTTVLQSDGKAPTTLQPYITVYFWHRTA